MGLNPIRPPPLGRSGGTRKANGTFAATRRGHRLHSSMRDPAVSVVVPTYESAAALPCTLRSLLTQTVDSRDFEIIVVDNGSSDDVERAVAPFAHFVRLIRIEHSVMSTVQNAGILACKGRFIAFLDAGDEWFSERLQAMLVLGAREKNSIVGTDYVWSTAGGREKIGHYAGRHILEFFDKSPRQQYKLALNETFISENSLSYMQLVPRRLLARIGAFDPTLSFGAHYDLWLRFLEAGVPMRVVPKPLAVCRAVGANSLSSSRFLTTAEDRVKILRRHRKDITGRQWREATGRLNHLRLQQALQNRRYVLALQDALRLMQNLPYLSRWAFERRNTVPDGMLLPKRP